VGLAVLSFVVNVVQSGNDPVSAFFLPFSRFWELGAGAVLALLHARAGRPVLEREWAGWVGLLLLAVAMVAIDRDRAFPGWWALLPVGGATLLIAAGERAWLNRIVLSHHTLVYIGLISYPLYLWHWLLLVFARIIRFQKEPTTLMSIGLILAAVGLAHLTYKFVERPIRSAGRLSVKAVALAAALAVCGGLGLVVYAKEGLPGRFPIEIRKRVVDPEKVVGSPQRRRCEYKVGVTLPPECNSEGPAGAPLVLVWGDSYGGHLIAGLRALQRERQDFRLVRAGKGGCPSMVDDVAARYRECNEVNASARQRIEALRPDTVIVAARWALYRGGTAKYPLVGAKDLTRTLEWLKAKGVQHIVVIGQMPHWKIPPSLIPLRNFQFSIFNRLAPTEKMPEWDSTYLNMSAFAVEDMVKRVALAQGATFISPAATLCDRGRCLITVPDSGGLPISRDDGHLTPAASTFFIARNASAIRPDYRKETPPR